MITEEEPVVITSFKDGSNFPVSIELIVCRLTPKIEASSSWLMLFSCRSALRLFFNFRQCIYDKKNNHQLKCLWQKQGTLAHHLGFICQILCFSRMVLLFTPPKTRPKSTWKGRGREMNKRNR